MKAPALLLLVLILFSCSEESNKTFIRGKWAGIIDEEYCELHYDSSEVYVFSLFMGNGGSFRYSATKDSVTYLDLEYSFGYEKLNDSLVVFRGESIDTFYRLPYSSETYDEINGHDSIAFNAFFESFFSRAKALYSYKGKDLEEVEVDSTYDEVFDFDMEVIVD